MRKFALIFIVLIIFSSGCLRGKEKIVTVTRYQCSNGQVVTNLNSCPAPQQSAQTTLAMQTTIYETQTTTPTTKFKTTTTCPCTSVTIKPKATTTIKLGPLCTTDADCGQPEYMEIRCRSGDAYRVKNTPQCREERIDNQKHCKTLSELQLLQECSSSERCLAEKGCVKDEG